MEKGQKNTCSSFCHSVPRHFPYLATFARSFVFVVMEIKKNLKNKD